MGKYKILKKTNTLMGEVTNEIPDPSQGYRPVVMENNTGVRHLVGWAKDTEDAVITTFFVIVDDEILPDKEDFDYMCDTTLFMERVNVKVEADPVFYFAAGIAEKFGAFVCFFDEECLDIQAYLDGRTPSHGDVG